MKSNEYIDYLNESIKKIYYMQEYEVAEEFQKRLEVLKNKFIEIERIHDLNQKQLIAKELAEFELEIDEYIRNEGKTKKVTLDRDIFEKKIKTFIEQSKDKTSKELIQELKEMTQSAKNMEVGNVLIFKINDLSAKALMEIYIRQIKDGEAIDLGLIGEITDTDRFIDQLQKKLIQMAQAKNQEESYDLLSLAKGINSENLSNSKIWTTLSGVENIRKIETREIDTKPYSTDLMIVETNKKSFFDRLRNKNKRGKTTKYILADINIKTGKYENVREEYHEFPVRSRLLKRKIRDKCIGIEVNDIDVVNITDILYMYNLKEINFGRNVREITMNELPSKNFLLDKSGKKKMAKPEKIFFSDDVKEVTKRTGNNASTDVVSRLEEVILGNGIKKIEEKMFYNAKKLTRVIFPNKLEKIENEAFYGCECLEKKIVLPETCEGIGNGAFNGCTNIQAIKCNVKYIGNECFSDCNNVKVMEFGERLSRIGADAFAGCKKIEDIIISKKAWLSDDTESWLHENYGKIIRYAEDVEEQRKKETTEIVQELKPISEGEKITHEDGENQGDGEMEI